MSVLAGGAGAGYWLSLPSSGIKADKPASMVKAPALSPSNAINPAPIYATDDSIAKAFAPDPVRVEAMRAALKALRSHDLPLALTFMREQPQIERDILLWVALRRQTEGLDLTMTRDFVARNPAWPSEALIAKRLEQALLREETRSEALLAAFTEAPPRSNEGKIAYARAALALQKREKALEILDSLWDDPTLSPLESASLLAEFGTVLTPDQHRARLRALLALEDEAAAAMIAPLLNEDDAALLAASQAMAKKVPDIQKFLEKIGEEARRDPLHSLLLARWHRRMGRYRDAAQALLAAGSEKIVAQADSWWTERRLVSRLLIENGETQLAYDVVKAHRGGSPETIADAHFHAGWYALRFLNDPVQAETHFKALQRSVSLPISRARAAYWLGRSAEARGDIDIARMHYQVAATDGFTFYGQLGRVKLRLARLDLPSDPRPTETDLAAFKENPIVQMLILLTEAGAEGDAASLYKHLAEQLPSAGEVALLARFARSKGNVRAALQVGKTALTRNLGTQALAFPLDALPERSALETPVEIPMLYAIARQESEFDSRAVSRAGAAGLMQLMPATASETASSLGLAFAPMQLIEDPGYNATLGAAYLAELIREFNGSYVLAFAAYNAGPRRVREWIARFGDPRDPAVDPVDWIELIPFAETRNYVQRVMENLQVYRERLSGAPLGIALDLRRGG